jgi:hypothetical protein
MRRGSQRLHETGLKALSHRTTKTDRKKSHA